MIVKEYDLKLHQLLHYATELVYIIKVRIWNFSYGLTHEFILGSKDFLLNNDIEISRPMVFMKLVKEEKKNWEEMSER